MAHVRVIVIGMVLAMLAPTALAAAPPAGLLAPGGSLAEGGATALFVLVKDHAFSFEAQAASVTLDAEYANYTTVSDPVGARPLYSQLEPLQHETRVLGASKVAFAAAQDAAGFLVLDSSGSMQSASRHAGPLQIRSVSDLVLDSDLATTSTGGHWEIHEAIPGTLVELAGAQGDYELRGTFVLELFGVDYQIESNGERALQRTGEIVGTDAGAAQRGRYEIDRVTLRDARLHVHAPGQAALYGASPLLQVPVGAALAILDAAGNPTGETREVGASGLRLDTALAPASAVVAPVDAKGAAGIPAWILVALGALAALGLGVVMLRRRARRDDFALAVHAMEERRFHEALAPLRRLRAKRPNDAAILLDEAICLEETGSLQEARAAYEATLAQWPTHAEAHYFLARTFARLRAGTDAARHLVRALELDPRLEELARRDAMLAQLPGESGVSA